MECRIVVVGGVVFVGRTTVFHIGGPVVTRGTTIIHVGSHVFTRWHTVVHVGSHDVRWVKEGQELMMKKWITRRQKVRGVAICMKEVGKDESKRDCGRQEQVTSRVRPNPV